MSQGGITYQQLDDTILEMLRVATVNAGYFVDKRAYLPETPTSLAAYQAAKTALASSVRLVDVIGNGIPKQMGEILMDTMYIHRTGNSKGSVSIFDQSSIDLNAGVGAPNYARVKTHGATQDVAYEVRFVSEDMRYVQILKQIIENALGTDKDYYPILDYATGDPIDGKKVLLEFTGSNDLNVYPYKEFVFTFVALDVWVVSSDTLPNGVQQVINPNIVPITEIIGTLDTEQSGNDNAPIT